MGRREIVRKVPMPGPWPNRGYGWCVWCGGRILIEAGKKNAGTPNMRRQWHPEPCLTEFFLHSRREYQFDHVKARDGLFCAWPGCNDAPERWLADRYPGPVLDYGYEASWAPPQSHLWSAKLLPAWNKPDPENHRKILGWATTIKRVTALELDHREPLWAIAHLPDDERRPYYGPTNLWLLCPDHHKAKTKREAAERAAMKRRGDFTNSPDFSASQHASV